MASSLLIYDGDCGGCTRAARWIESRWPDGAASIVAYQALGADGLSRHGLTLIQAESQVWWVDERGPVGGERAVARALLVAGGGLSPLGRVVDSPLMRPLTARIYRWVARHRHLLPGASSACRVTP